MAAALAAGLTLGPTTSWGQAAGPPEVVPALALETINGEWFEVAGTGTWSRRRCVANTRFLFSARRDPRSLDATSVCTTERGVERRRGRLRASDGTGALRLRLVPALFAFLPAAWDDFWVLAVGEDGAWLLVGDRHRGALSVLSRTVALDEASYAQALVATRARSYDVGRLQRVDHPAGATGLKTGR